MKDVRDKVRTVFHSASWAGVRQEVPLSVYNEARTAVYPTVQRVTSNIVVRESVILRAAREGGTTTW